MVQGQASKTAVVILLMLAYASFSGAQVADSTFLRAEQPASDSVSRAVSEIIIIGNRITKQSVIYRELAFHPGDTIEGSRIENYFLRSEENLMNTSLFNSVNISRLNTGERTMTVYILLAERWYIFPLPIFEVVDRNFNEWWRTKDFSKINYGAIVTWNNFRGRGETIGATVRLGYTQRISFFYSIPYITSQQHSGLSFAFAYSRNHETAFRNYYNDLVYFKDQENFSRKEISGSVQYIYRHGLYKTHLVEAGYRRAEVEDTIVRLNPDFFSPFQSHEKYFSLRYIYKLEHRDFVTYPLHGSFFNIEIAKAGLPVLKDDIDFSFAAINYKRYWQLGKKIYFASSVSGKISDQNPQPFYNIGGLGFGSLYLRGYEYYVMLGKNYALLKTNFKYQLLGTHLLHARFIPLEKFATIPYAFYFNIYGDAGYVEDRQFPKYNSLVNSMQYSFGAGLDFVTYYDLVFRLEYSVNKFGESGIFIHFSAPI